jgi:hypothetical protein
LGDQDGTPERAGQQESPVDSQPIQAIINNSPPYPPPTIIEDTGGGVGSQLEELKEIWIGNYSIMHANEHVTLAVQVLVGASNTKAERRNPRPKRLMMKLHSSQLSPTIVVALPHQRNPLPVYLSTSFFHREYL